MSRHRTERRRPAAAAHPAAAISSALSFRRDLVAPFDMWDECPRTTCRQARVCRSPVVAFFGIPVTLYQDRTAIMGDSRGGPANRVSTDESRRA
jgi:hypothetical protein